MPYNYNYPMQPQTYVNSYGILAPVAPVIAPVTPNLGQYNIYIDQNKLAEQEAYQKQLLAQKEAELMAQNAAIIAANEQARKEQEYQTALKVQEQIAYQAQLTLAAEEKKRQEEIAAQIAAAAAVNVVANPVAAIDYVNKINTTISDLKQTTAADPNNYSAANAALTIANHIINFNEEIKAIAVSNPAPEVIAAAEIINVVVAKAAATANDSMKDIIIKDQIVADNAYLYLKEKAESNDATPEDVTNALLAEERLKEANNNLVEVQTVVNESKQLVVELKAEVESKAAENILIKKELKSKNKKSGWLDNIVNYIYSQIYKK